MLNKKGLNRGIDFAAKTKKKLSKKAILDKTKISHQILLESSESDVFRIRFLTFKGCLWFRRYFILWQIDYFNFAIFFLYIFSTFSLKKIKKIWILINFEFFVLKIKHHNSWKEKNIFVEKNMTNLTAIFLHGTGWLNTLFIN